jgi:hypothetical protein
MSENVGVQPLATLKVLHGLYRDYFTFTLSILMKRAMSVVLLEDTQMESSNSL